MKTWGEVNDDLPARECFIDCIKRGVLTSDNAMQVYTVTYDINGVGYGRYVRLTLEEIDARGGFICFFDGFQVIWPDVIINPWPVGEKPFKEHSKEIQTVVYKKIAHMRRYTGSRNEVKAICGG